MKSKVKKILLYMLTFLLGAMVTTIIIIMWMGLGLEHELQMMKHFYITYEVEEANKNYFSNHNSPIKIHSLEHLIRYLEQVCTENQDAECEKATYYDMVTFYVRLGQLYEHMGELKVASQSFEKALKLKNEKKLFEKWIGTEKEINTIGDIKEYVGETDISSQKQ